MGTDRRVVRADAKKVGLHSHVVRIVDPHTVALVAGNHIVKNKGVLKERAPDERVVVRVSDGNTILSIAQRAGAGGIRADEVAAQQIAGRTHR